MWILLSIRYLKGILVYLNTLITRFGKLHTLQSHVGVFMTIIHAFLTLSPLDWVQLIGDSAWQGQRAEEGDVEKESTWQRNPRGSGEVRNHGLKVCWQRSSQRCQKQLRSRAKWGMSTVDLSSNGLVDWGEATHVWPRRGCLCDRADDVWLCCTLGTCVLLGAGVVPTLSIKNKKLNETSAHSYDVEYCFYL